MRHCARMSRAILENLVGALVISAALALTVVPAVSLVQGQSVRAVDRRDIDGVWSFATLTPLERPAAFEGRATITDTEAAEYERQLIASNDRDRRWDDRAIDVSAGYNEFWFDRGAHLARVNGQARTSLIVDPADGRIPPLTPTAARREQAREQAERGNAADGPEVRPLPDRCLGNNAGPPMSPSNYNNYVQLLGFRDHVVIHSEMIHDARIVPIDGRPDAPGSILRWMGESRGRWEGGTLVVETTHFSDKTSFHGSDEHLHLTERFTRVGADTLLYQFTIDDLTAFTRKWTAVLPMTRTPQRIFEYACHEGNYALEDILRGARAEERGNGGIER
jgi:hypothetical protein